MLVRVQESIEFGKAAALLMLVLAGAGPAIGAAVVSANVVNWQPAKLVRGSPVLFRVSVPADVKELRGKWLGHEAMFFSVPGSKVWYSLAGIPVETSPGSYDLELTGTRGARSFHYVKRIRIAP